MGRWIDYEIQRDFTDWLDLADAHNADCDAYEARIAELEATLTRAGLIDMAAENRRLTDELARVKAESLRVVPDGEAKPLDDVDARFIEYNGHIYQWNEVLDHDKSAIPIYGGSPVGIRMNNRDVPVKPVRLERWEK